MTLTMDNSHKLISKYSLKWTISIVFLIVALFPALGAQLDPSILPVADMSNFIKSEVEIVNDQWYAEEDSNLPWDDVRSMLESIYDEALVIKRVNVMKMEVYDWKKIIIILLQQNYICVLMYMLEKR
jgi:hypothetical protein